MRAAPFLALALVSAVATARAEPANAPAAAPEQTDAAKRSEAQHRFQHGIELYKESDFRAAQVEFTRAYELVPSYKLLYNLGQVAYQRRDHAAALRYFRQYLADGVDAIPAERRQQVSGDIADLEQRVGRVQVDTLEEGAEVFVDDVMVGKTPLRALVTVNGGPRKIDLVARGGEHQSRQVDVGSGEIVRVPFPRLSLPPPSAAVAPPPPRREAALAVTTPAPAIAPAAAEITVTSTVAPPTASLVAKPAARRSSTPWKAWTATGLLAGGAAVTGWIALSAKHDLDAQLSKFPADDSEIDYDRRRTHGFALATDGLLIGTAVLATISLYLTVREPR
jgi:tetratricopeptide (TPR) repeat protein